MKTMYVPVEAMTDLQTLPLDTIDLFTDFPPIPILSPNTPSTRELQFERMQPLSNNDNRM